MAQANTSTTAADQRRKQRRLKPNERAIRDFKPRVSHPTRPMSFTLQTHMVQELFDRQYYRTAIAIYNVIVMCNEIGEAETAAELRLIVNSMIDSAGEEILGEVARLSELRTQRNSSLLDMTHPQTVNLDVTTPQAERLIRNVVLPLDQLMCELEACWFDGEIDEAEKKDCAYSWRHRVAHLLGELVALQGRSLESVRRRKEELQAAAASRAAALAAARAEKGEASTEDAEAERQSSAQAGASVEAAESESAEVAAA